MSTQPCWLAEWLTIIVLLDFSQRPHTGHCHTAAHCTGLEEDCPLTLSRSVEARVEVRGLGPRVWIGVVDWGWKWRGHGSIHTMKSRSHLGSSAMITG